MTHDRAFENRSHGLVPVITLSNGVPVQVAGKKQRDDGNNRIQHDPPSLPQNHRCF